MILRRRLMSNAGDKLEEVFKVIGEINDEPIKALMNDTFMLALRTLKEANQKKDAIDISEQLEIVTRALNFPLEDMIMHVLQTKFAGQNNSCMPETQYDINSKETQYDINSKAADEETLDFITADIDTDDYETFLKENGVQETLEDLKKEI